MMAPLPTRRNASSRETGQRSDEFVRLGGGGNRLQLVGQEEMDALVAEADAAQRLSERGQPPCTPSRLLLQLAAGAGLGRLPRFEAAGGDLQHLAANGCPELADQEDPAVGQQRQDGGTAGVAHDLEIGAAAIGKPVGFDRQGDDPSPVDAAPDAAHGAAPAAGGKTIHSSPETARRVTGSRPK